MTGFIGDTDTLMGLRSLHITPSLVPNSRPSRRQHQLLSMLSTSPESSGGSDFDSLSDVDSSSSILGFDEDRDFPVEILPDLFLGNAANSEDLEWLKKHRIEVRKRVCDQNIPSDCTRVDWCTIFAYYHVSSSEQ